MSKRFVILVSPDDAELSAKIMDYIHSHQMLWWHWTTGAYLLKSENSELTCRKIRDDMRELLPGTVHLVMEISEAVYISWCGTGPKLNESDMYDWLRKNWTRGT